MTWRCSLAALALLAAACRRGMENQPKVLPMTASRFFADGRSARDPVPGTVSRGAPDDAAPPPPLTPALLSRGRERYDIDCSPCHGRTGVGDGMIVRRGFPRPPSFHEERLRRAPDRRFFDVMTNGFGTMFPYAERVSVRDRWAIAAYIRALQLSRTASLADVPVDRRAELEAPR